MPKLVDFTISTENSNELGETFNTTYLESITKGQKHNHYESLQSKITYTKVMYEDLPNKFIMSYSQIRK